MKSRLSNLPAPSSLGSEMRQTIIEAADELFSAAGFAGTTMGDIAAKSGCSVGYLYKHFSGKRALVEALSLHHREAIIGIRQQVRDKEKRGGLDFLQRELELVCAYMLEHYEFVRAHFQAECYGNKNKADYDDAFRDEDIALIKEAQRRGEIVPGDPELLVALTSGAIWNLFRVMAAAGDFEGMKRIPKIVDELVYGPLHPAADPTIGKDTAK